MSRTLVSKAGPIADLFCTVVAVVSPTKLGKQLMADANDYTLCELAKKYGVSFTAVRRALIRLGVDREKHVQQPRVSPIAMKVVYAQTQCVEDTALILGCGASTVYKRLTDEGYKKLHYSNKRLRGGTISYQRETVFAKMPTQEVKDALTCFTMNELSHSPAELTLKLPSQPCLVSTESLQSSSSSSTERSSSSTTSSIQSTYSWPSSPPSK